MTSTQNRPQSEGAPTTSSKPRPRGGREARGASISRGEAPIYAYLSESATSNIPGVSRPPKKPWRDEPMPDTEPLPFLDEPETAKVSDQDWLGVATGVALTFHRAVLSTLGRIGGSYRDAGGDLWLWAKRQARLVVKRYAAHRKLYAGVALSKFPGAPSGLLAIGVLLFVLTGPVLLLVGVPPKIEPARIEFGLSHWWAVLAVLGVAGFVVGSGLLTLCDLGMKVLQRRIYVLAKMGKSSVAGSFWFWAAVFTACAGAIGWALLH